MDKLEQIPLADIYYDPDLNIRKDVTPSSVRELADEIQQSGLIQPIILAPYDGERKYRIICGNRRFKAHELLGWTHAECIVRYGLSEREMWKLNGEENIARKDFTIWEEALWLNKLYPGGVPAFKDVSKELQKSTRWIEIRFRLLGMHKEIQKAAHQRRINNNEIRWLQQIPDPDLQFAKFKQALKEKRKYGRSTVLRKNRPQQKKSSKEVSKILNHLLDAEIVGLTPKIVAWTQGWFTDEAELIRLIKEEGTTLRTLAERVEALEAEVERLRND